MYVIVGQKLIADNFSGNTSSGRHYFFEKCSLKHARFDAIIIIVSRHTWNVPNVTYFLRIVSLGISNRRNVDWRILRATNIVSTAFSEHTVFKSKLTITIWLKSFDYVSLRKFEKNVCENNQRHQRDNVIAAIYFYATSNREQIVDRRKFVMTENN